MSREILIDPMTRPTRTPCLPLRLQSLKGQGLI